MLEDRVILRPVMVAHLITKQYKVERSSEYKSLVVPIGGSEAYKMFYEYIHVYIDKLEKDLKKLGLWDPSG